jgi:type II secretory pathway pseudopilin PulG
MFHLHSSRNSARETERGFFLIAAIFAVTLIIIALAAGIPAIRGQIKRDREDELIHRGHQYTRAIQLYYRKFGRYPNSIDDLENTNNLRFLRRKYTDPITGKDEWRLIHYGEAQPKPIPPYLSRPGGTGGGGGIPASGLSSGVSTAGATNASDMSTRVSNSTTNTPGVGPIVGIASTSDAQSLKEVDGKTKYSDWEFVYDPSLDPSRGGAGANNANGQGLGNGLNGLPNNGGRGVQNNNPGGNPNPTPRPPGGR